VHGALQHTGFATTSSSFFRTEHTQASVLRVEPKTRTTPFVIRIGKSHQILLRKILHQSEEVRVIFKSLSRCTGYFVEFAAAMVSDIRNHIRPVDIQNPFVASSGHNTPVWASQEG